MSDHSISIVPRQSSYPENKVKATEILDWLVSQDIVKPALSDCILSSDNGYAIADGARRITNRPDKLPFALKSNGLEIITTRWVFDTGENGMEECICPVCKKDISSEEWSFFNDWYGQKSNSLTCPLCNIATDIHNFQFKPEWGFSDLGFRFWNWPDLTDAFIEEFRIKLGLEISLVYQHI